MTSFVPIVVPDHNDGRVITFGNKHSGHTYKHVFDMDPSYCCYVLEQEDPSGGMIDFQQWLIPQVGQLTVPREATYEGTAFERLYVEQSNFCDWVLSKEATVPWVKVLQKYLVRKYGCCFCET